MTKIDIISGFLGAGKTTLIKKLLAEAFPGEKLVLIENEFGEISIDGGFLKESGVQISEMSSGCICCSLVGDFNKALRDVAGNDAVKLIKREEDPTISGMVAAWPRNFDPARALSLGYRAESSFREIVEIYIADDLPKTS